MVPLPQLNVDLSAKVLDVTKMLSAEFLSTASHPDEPTTVQSDTKLFAVVGSMVLGIRKA
jgi:hypothetical protein